MKLARSLTLGAFIALCGGGAVACTAPMSEATHPDQYTGIGVELAYRDERLWIVNLVEDGPAHEAGLQIGDQIIQVDDLPTKGARLRDAVGWLRGPPGSKVRVEIERSGKELLLELARGRFKKEGQTEHYSTD